MQPSCSDINHLWQSPRPSSPSPLRLINPAPPTPETCFPSSRERWSAPCAADLPVMRLPLSSLYFPTTTFNEPPESKPSSFEDKFKQNPRFDPRRPRMLLLVVELPGSYQKEPHHRIHSEHTLTIKPHRAPTEFRSRPQAVEEREEGCDRRNPGLSSISSSIKIAHGHVEDEEPANYPLLPPRHCRSSCTT